MGVIGGMYSDFTSPLAMVALYASLGLLALLFGMVLFRKDGRHLGDMLAGTQVVRAPKLYAVGNEIVNTVAFRVLFTEIEPPSVRVNCLASDSPSP